MARILIISCTPYGQDSRVKRHIQALVGRGDEVDVLCLENPRTARINGVNVTGVVRPRYHRRGGLGGLCYAQFSISAAFRAIRFSLRRRYDVVVVRAMRTATILCAAPMRLLGSRVILDLGDDTPEAHHEGGTRRLSALRARLLMMEEAFRARFADRVIVAHAIHRQLLVQAGIPECKIRVVLDAPDPKIFKWRQRDDYAPGAPFTIVSYGAKTSRLDASVPLPILYFGSIASCLSIDVAIHAISLLRHRVPDIRLHVIGGSDAYIVRARAVTEFLNLSKLVTFHDQVSLDTPPSILDNAILGLVPTDSVSAAHIVLPPQLMRFAALGIPSIAPRLRAIEPYFGEDAVRLYESGNARALADAIENLYEHPDVRREMARRAVGIAESLGWEHQRRQLLEAIDSLLEEKTAARPAAESSIGVIWRSVEWVRIGWFRSKPWRGENPALVLLRNTDIMPAQPILLEMADAIASANVPALPAYSGILPDLRLPEIVDNLRETILALSHRLDIASAVALLVKPSGARATRCQCRLATTAQPVLRAP